MCCKNLISFILGFYISVYVIGEIGHVTLSVNA